MLSKLFSAIDSYLEKAAVATSTPPLKKPVNVAPPEVYLAEAGYRKLGWRAWRRRVVFRLSGQERFKIKTLETHIGKRGLWLYFGEDQIGDALMDLAPRSLLAEHGFSMDLFTSKPLARLFQGDPWFKSVISDVSLASGAPYDFVIALSHKRRSLLPKIRHFRGLPWVSILEDFTGPNFDRAGYATQRLSDLLGLELDAAEFSRHARQKLKPGDVPEDLAQEPVQLRRAIALSIGGVDPLRTYSRWPEVIAQLVSRGKNEFLLVGSANGVSEAETIARQAGNTAQVHNFVGKCSLAESHRLLATARVAVCADGGLMHLAATTQTPLVGIFSSAIRPEWRLPSRPATMTICSASADINDASPLEVADKILLLHNESRR